jgi:hypothetical protein
MIMPPLLHRDRRVQKNRHRHHTPQAGTGIITINNRHFEEYFLPL